MHGVLGHSGRGSTFVSVMNHIPWMDYWQSSSRLALILTCGYNKFLVCGKGYTLTDHVGLWAKLGEGSQGKGAEE